MHYVCTRCGRTEEADTRAFGCRCGGTFRIEDELPAYDPVRIDAGEWSIFRYRDFLSVDAGDIWRKISLGEGMTPVIRLDEGLFAKLDYLMPTLSFKDRGAAALMTHCVRLGADRVIQDSSGNAGNSIAAYAARAGIACEIFVPEHTSPAKIAMIRAHGAVCTIVPGSREDCAAACREKAEKTGIFYASHVFQPVFYEGTKTWVYEVLEQMGRIPRHLLIPVGNGTLFLGVMHGLQHLRESGAIEEMPQIIAVQSEYCDPLFRAAGAREDEPVSVAAEPTLAEGIAIAEPARGREILELAKTYGVRFVHAKEDDILRARKTLAEKGLYVEHTTAANLAGLWEYRRKYGSAQDCLITLCGAGLKSDH